MISQAWGLGIFLGSLFLFFLPLLPPEEAPRPEPGSDGYCSFSLPPLEGGLPSPSVAPSFSSPQASASLARVLPVGQR